MGTNVISVDDAILEIAYAISHSSGQPPDWYAGITKNPEGRVFGDHKVPPKSDDYVICLHASMEDAHKVETHFHDLGSKGKGNSPGGADEASVFAYAYLMTDDTEP